MTRAAFVLLLLLVGSCQHTPAYAYSCADVKAWIAQYGVTRSLIMAKLYGVTAAQIQQARACLRGRS